MSENAKVVALLLLLLVLFGVAGEMDYQDALRSEQPYPAVNLLPVREPVATDDAANGDCSNAGNLKTTDVHAANDGSRPVRYRKGEQPCMD